MRSFFILLNSSFKKYIGNQNGKEANMPLKKGACVVCNDTKRCSVCKGNGKTSKEGREVACGACGGSGKCAHCIHKHNYGGWAYH